MDEQKYEYECNAKLIGACLIDIDSLSVVVENDIKPEMLSDKFYSEALNIMLSKFDTGDRLTMQTIVNEMVNNKRDSKMVEKALSDAMIMADSSVFTADYCKAIDTCYKRRKLKEFFNKVKDDMNPNNIDSVLADCRLLIDTLEAHKDIKILSAHDLVETYKDTYFTDKIKRETIKTGEDWIDDDIYELAKGDLTVIGARPSIGKSALLSQIVCNMADKYKIGYFNLEMTDTQIYERMLARYMKKSITRIKNSFCFLGDEKSDYDLANETINNFNLDLITSYPTVSDIRNICRCKHYDVVVIDYLQLIKVEKGGRSRDEEIGKISRTLKMMAMDFDMHVIL